MKIKLLEDIEDPYYKVSYKVGDIITVPEFRGVYYGSKPDNIGSPIVIEVHGFGNYTWTKKYEII